MASNGDISVRPEKSRHGVDLLKSITELKKRKILTDFKLKVGKVSIQAHKVVLASCSKYYEAMFVYETQKGCEELQDLHEGAVESCINYMYTGEIMVTHENVKEIFKAAHKFMIKELEDLSSTFLSNVLTFENCLGIRALAHKNKDEKLKAKADQFVVEHFDDVAATDSFILLSKYEVCQYLKAMKSETCASEMSKWRAMLKWCKHEEKERRKFFPDLFKYLKLQCLEHKFINSVIARENLVDRYKKSREAVREVLGEFLDGTIEEKKLRDAQEKADNNTTECIAVLDRETCQIHALNLRTGEKFTLVQIRSKIEQEVLSCIVSVQNKLYFQYDKNTFMLERNNNWIAKGALRESPSHDAKLVGFEEFIYLIEGNKLSRCNTKLSRWDNNLNPCKLDEIQCVASSDKYIYALGDGNKAKQYNPETGEWAELSPMMNIRKGSAAVATSNMLYVLGGYKNTEERLGYTVKPCNKVKCYDLKTHYWTTMPTFHIPRANFCACVANGKVYCVGGISHEYWTGTPEKVEACSLDFKKWDPDVGVVGPVDEPVSACHFVQTKRS